MGRAGFGSRGVGVAGPGVAGAVFDDVEMANGVLARLPPEDLLAVDRFNVFGGGVPGQGHPPFTISPVRLLGTVGSLSAKAGQAMNASSIE